MDYPANLYLVVIGSRISCQLGVAKYRSLVYKHATIYSDFGGFFLSSHTHLLLTFCPSMSPSTEKRASSPTASDPEASAENEKLKAEVYNVDIDTSGVDEKKLIRKIDIALIPWLSFLYLLSFLDRTSIGK